MTGQFYYSPPHYAPITFIIDIEVFKRHQCLQETRDFKVIFSPTGHTRLKGRGPDGHLLHASPTGNIGYISASRSLSWTKRTPSRPGTIRSWRATSLISTLNRYLRRGATPPQKALPSVYTTAPLLHAECTSLSCGKVPPRIGSRSP